MVDNGEIESASSSDDEMPPLEDCSNVEVAEPIDGVVFVTRHALNIQPKEDGDVEQHEHIFHIRCHINDKEFTYAFPEEVSHGLPRLRGIEHQIDLIPSCPIPNRPAYRINLEETKEIQSKMNTIKLVWKKVMNELVKSFSSIAAPFNELVKKNVVFKWDEKLNDKLTNTPLLCLSNFDKAFQIECDASGVGIGA
ncbi:hypothetical protein CR513_25761, partial [Mucuna pruriens]